MKRAFISVSLSFTSGGGATSYKVDVGGVPAAGNTLNVPLSATSHATVEVGPTYFGGTNAMPSPGWTFDYDNIICY